MKQTNRLSLSMKNEKQNELEKVAKMFCAWRKNRKRGARIPLRLWKEAVDLADKYPLSFIAEELSLNRLQLEKRVFGKKSMEKQTPAFVELPRPPEIFSKNENSDCEFSFACNRIFGLTINFHLRLQIDKLPILKKTKGDKR